MPESLSERRESKKEELLRYLRESAKDPEGMLKRARQGMVAVAESRQGKRVKQGFKPWHQASTRPGSNEDLRETQAPIPASMFDIPVLKKRTAEQKLESLTRRLIKEAQRTQKATGIFAVPEVILKEVVGEYWKIGTPVTEETLRRVAMKFLTQEENRLRSKGANVGRVPNITVTRG